jgi:hypothetical protein
MAKRVVFGIAAALSLIALWLVFSLRYEWYTDSDSLIVLRASLGLGIAAIVGCWVLVPSRAIVSALGIATLVFPPFVDRDFVLPDIRFAPFILGVAALLALATHLRRALGAGARVT